MPINPYESPLQPTEAVRPTPWWMQAVHFCGLAVGVSMLLGALANALNGWVCPEYFTMVMGWDEDSNIWLRGILQGMLEGLVIGVVLSLGFFGVGGLLTRFRLTLGRAARYLAAIATAAVLCALAGGMICCGVNAALDRIGVYSDGSPNLRQRYGWVSGCISGLELGGAGAAVLALIVLVVRDWTKLRSAATADRASPADAKTPAAD